MVHVFAERFKLMILWGVIGALLFTGASFLLPLEYSADSSVLLISRTQAGVDPYTQAKSAERIGENVAQLMTTGDFYQKVIESKIDGFDTAYWRSLSERDRRKQWPKNVVGTVRYGASILSIKVYAQSREQAVAFGEAVTKTVVERGWEYVGGDVVFKEVDAPLASQLPTRPNFVVNAGIGFWVGIVVSGLWFVTYRRRTMFRA
jgi:capsular polysaccharide biosynthesis protein